MMDFAFSLKKHSFSFGVKTTYPKDTPKEKSQIYIFSIYCIPQCFIECNKGRENHPLFLYSKIISWPYKLFFSESANFNQ